MLLTFTTKNHRCLRDEQTLSLIASSLDPDDATLLRPRGLDVAVVRSAAIYGANASGKSSLFGAFQTMGTAVIQSHVAWVVEGELPVEPFALAARKGPSQFEVNLYVQGVRFRYGFELNAREVVSEWLYAWPGTRKQTWFERDGADFWFGRNLDGSNRTIASLTRTNSLFLSAAAQNNHAALTPLYRWFADSVVRKSHGGNPAKGRVLHLIPRVGADLLAHQSEILGLLRGADTGIEDMRIEARPKETRAADGGPLQTSFEIQFRHAAKADRWLDLEAESHGTQTLMHFAIRAFPVLARGGFMFIDELERSWHPLVTDAVLRLFQDPKSNPKGAQLVFTTHDPHLLRSGTNGSALRRDQVWFVEKDDRGAGKLYPLTDFHPRQSENIERGYLQGRYGGVPHTSSSLALANKKAR